MVLQSAFAAWRQVMSPELRGILWKSLFLTVALLALVWFALTRTIAWFFQDRSISADYEILDTVALWLAGAGLVVGLAFLLPAVSLLVAGYFLDDAAEIVEKSDFPEDAPGRPMSLGLSLLYGLRFAGLALLVNAGALLLLFVPLVNVAAFFGANAYLLGREYFELAAGRFRSMPEAAQLRSEHRGTVLAAGAILAGMVVIPVVNLLTPIFGVALMVHLHKRLVARRALTGGGTGGAPRLPV
jgi:CysZ protein